MRLLDRGYKMFPLLSLFLLSFSVPQFCGNVVWSAPGRFLFCVSMNVCAVLGVCMSVYVRLCVFVCIVMPERESTNIHTYI
jgi:hypothetical protein